MALMLPNPSNTAAIREFAASFNGYEHFGSFAACADEAKARKRDSLIALRNELFFEFRAANHQGNSGYVERYRELLPLFEQFLKDG